MCSDVGFAYPFGASLSLGASGFAAINSGSVDAAPRFAAGIDGFATSGSFLAIRDERVPLAVPEGESVYVKDSYDPCWRAAWYDEAARLCASAPDPEGSVLMPKLPGMLVGLGVTAKTFFKTVFPDGPLAPPAPSKGSHTVQYPHVKEAPADRARGVIALHHDNCTACMLCARECPDWCIYIEGHKELAPPRRAGGKPRQKNKLDRFDIDFALCMYCGICVEVCPFDALFWSPEYEFSELKIADLLHDKSRLADWMETVPEFGPYESGAEVKAKKLPSPSS